jgi:hypothetical protein
MGGGQGGKRGGGGALTIGTMAGRTITTNGARMDTEDPLLEAKANMRKNAGDPKMHGRGKEWARYRLMRMPLEYVPGLKRRQSDSLDERPAKRRRAGVAAKRVTFADPPAAPAAPMPPPPPTFEELSTMLSDMKAQLAAMEKLLQEAAQKPRQVDVDIVDGIVILQSDTVITDRAACAAQRENDGIVSDEVITDRAACAAQRENDGVAIADAQQLHRIVSEVLVTFDDYSDDSSWLPKMRVEVVDAEGTTRGMTPEDMRAASHEMRADTVLTVLEAIRGYEIPDTDDPEAYIRRQLTEWSLEATMDDFYATRFRAALRQFAEGEHADDDDSDFEGEGISPSDVSDATARWNTFLGCL